MTQHAKFSPAGYSDCKKWPKLPINAPMDQHWIDNNAQTQAKNHVVAGAPPMCPLILFGPEIRSWWDSYEESLSQAQELAEKQFHEEMMQGEW